MSIALVDHAKYTGGANGGTSASMNSTGANLLVLELSAYTGLTSAVTAANISDTYSNTWVSEANLNPGSGNVQVYTCANPVVGTGHTVTIAKTNIFISFAVQAWSGVDNVTGLAAHNSNTIASGSPTTIQPGSVTPAVNHCLVISSVYLDNNVNSASIDSGFTISDAVPFTSGSCEGMTAAYLLQSTAAAVNPTWTLSSAASSAGTASWIGVYQPATGGAAVIPAPGVFPLIGLSTLGWIIKRRNKLRQLLQAAAAGLLLAGTAAAQSITPGPGTTIATPVSPTLGGTGIANGAGSTLTLGGGFATTLTETGATSLTLPTSGTVTALGNTVTGSGGTLVEATSPTLVTPTLGVAAATSVTHGTAGSVLGTAVFNNVTSGSITLEAQTGALGSAVVTLPAATDQLVGRATTDTLTNKTISGGSLTGSVTMPDSNVWNSSGLIQSLNSATAIALNNNNAGTAAETDFTATNGLHSGKLRFFGQSFTTSGLTRQDGAMLSTDGAGGLTLATLAAQPIYFGINGAQALQIDANRHQITSGPTPTCGTGCSSVAGNDNAFVATTGTAQTSISVNFGASWGAAPVCNVSSNSTASVTDIASVSISAVTFGASVALTGGLLYVNCRQ